MNIKDKIVKLAKEQGKTLRGVAAVIETTEMGLQYMFRNNSFKFDNMLKISEYLNVDISYFSDNNSNVNTQIKPSNSVEKQKYVNKIELNDAFETSKKAERIKKNIESDNDVSSYLNDLTISTLSVELINQYLEAGIFNKYKNLFNLMLLDIEKGISLNMISEKYYSEMKDLIENSSIKKETLSQIKKHLLSIYVLIEKDLSEDKFSEFINEINEIRGSNKRGKK